MNWTSLSGSHLSLLSSSSVLSSDVSSQRLGVLQTASLFQHLQFVNFLWHHRFGVGVIWVNVFLLIERDAEGMVLPEKSQCWWCSCISVPGPARPYQPKTAVSPQSHPELRKKSGSRWRLREEIISTGSLYLVEMCLSPPCLGRDLCSEPRVRLPLDLLTSYSEAVFFSFSKSPKKKKASPKLERFNKNLNFAIQAHCFRSRLHPEFSGTPVRTYLWERDRTFLWRKRLQTDRPRRCVSPAWPTAASGQV